MTGAIITIVVIVLVFLLFYIFDRWMERRLTNLYRERTSPEAKVRAPCYIRESHMEEPGVAQIMDGILSIFTVTGKEVRVPLDQVRLTKMRKNKYLIGRFPWWGKTCFWLNSPRTYDLVLGFSRPEPWSSSFKVQ